MTATVTCTARPEGASQTDWAQASIGKLISPPNLNLSGYPRAEMVLRRIVHAGLDMNIFCCLLLVRADYIRPRPRATDGAGGWSWPGPRHLGQSLMGRS